MLTLLVSNIVNMYKIALNQFKLGMFVGKAQRNSNGSCSSFLFGKSKITFTTYGVNQL